MTVNIARSLEEAEAQRELGRAVIASDQDDEVYDPPTAVNNIDDEASQDSQEIEAVMSAEEASEDQNYKDSPEDSSEKTA